MFSACIIYTLFIWILSWLFLLTCTEWGSDWGVALTTAAKIYAHAPYANIIIEYYAMKGASPLEAVAWVAFSMIFVLFLLGEIMIWCNLWAKRGVGTVIVSGVILLAFVLRFLPLLPRWAVWFSPVSWTDRSLLQANQNLPPHSYAAGMLIGFSILLGAVILLTIHRCDLDATKE